VITFLIIRFKRNYQLKQTIRTSHISIEDELQGFYCGKKRGDAKGVPISRKSSELQNDTLHEFGSGTTDVEAVTLVDGKSCRESDLYFSLESLNNDYHRIINLIDFYFYRLQEEYTEPESILTSLRNKALASLHNKVIELTSKARKELWLIERQLQCYFQNLDSDLTMVFATLNKFYDNP
jgi:hypothetical protein